MTTIETASEHDPLSDQPAPGFAEVDGGDSELLWVDPRELVIRDNVRTDVALGKEFIADIAARGVRQVIQVRRDESGHLVVRTGQRRDRGWCGPGSGPGRGRGAHQRARPEHRADLGSARGERAPQRPG